jgi:uncharacterized protein
MLLIFTSFLFQKDKVNKNTQPQKRSKYKVYRETMIDNEKYYYAITPLTAILIAFIVGMLSGFFGIGGGSLMVPAMILLFQFPPHIATATSMFMILSLSTVSSFTHIMLGHIEWAYVWAFIPGAWFGGVLGAKISQHMSSKAVEYLLRIVLLLIGLRLIWQGIYS